MKDKVKHYFDSYPKNQRCFETSDGYLFHALEKATAHAGKLVNPDVKTWDRAPVTAEDPDTQGESEETSNPLEEVHDVTIEAPKSEKKRRTKKA